MYSFYFSGMKERDNSIDILRGLAIFSMIAANMAPYNYAEPHPGWFRIFGSIAAPMFVFLAGMMVSYTSTIKSHPLSYYLKRSFATLVVAAFIDAVIWDIFPFITYDVLYIIALGMPAIFFFNKLRLLPRIFILIFIFSITPLLQYYLGYTESPSEVILSDGDISNQLSQIAVWRQFLHEGWFPFFPWIGVALAGAMVGSYKLKTEKAAFNTQVFFAGLSMMLTGIALWYFFSPAVMSNDGYLATTKPELFWHVLLTRDGYSELFYPPTLFFMLTYIGFIFILIPITDKLQHLVFLKWLPVFGRSSMLVYLLHTVFIAFFFSNEDLFEGGIGQHALMDFTLLFLAHAALIWIICFLIQKYKKGKQFPFAVNFILGG